MLSLNFTSSFILATTTQLVLQVIVASAAVISIIVYRVVIYFVFATYFQEEGIESSYITPSLMTTVTGSTLSLLLIACLNLVSCLHTRTHTHCFQFTVHILIITHTK